MPVNNHIFDDLLVFGFASQSKQSSNRSKVLNKAAAARRFSERTLPYL